VQVSLYKPIFKVELSLNFAFYDGIRVYPSKICGSIMLLIIKPLTNI